jgi:hypothetical protein
MDKFYWVHSQLQMNYGSFHTAMLEAWFKASLDNKLRLEESFPEYFNFTSSPLDYFNIIQMKDDIREVIEQFSYGNYSKEQATNEILDLFNDSGMFSSEKLEQAYKDGVRDTLTKGYGTFDEENYR